MEAILREYTTARTIFGIIEFVAWIAVIIGIVMAVSGSGSGSYAFRSGAGLIGALPGLVLSLLGIIAVGAAQFFRAGVDTADMTGHILAISKEQLKIAKDAQKAGFAAEAIPAKPTAVKAPEPATTPSNADPAKLGEQMWKDQGQSEKIEAPPSASYQYQVEHQGETIMLERGKANWGGQSFDSVDAAKEYVTRVKGNGRAQPIVPSPNDRPVLTAKRDVPKGLSR